MMVSEDPRGRQINAMGRARSLLLLLLCHTCCALEVTVSPSQIAKVKSDALLSCTFKVEKTPVNPQFLAIFWHFGELEIVRYDSKGKGSQPRFSIDDQAVQQGDASLTIHNVTISDKGTYKCTVVYSPNNQEKQIQLNILAIPVVKIQKNAVRSGVTSLLQCSITNFFPENMKVIWLKNGQILSGSVTQDDKTNVDMTYTRRSLVNVTFLEEQGKPEIICQVEHEYLQDPIKDLYIIQYGAAPTVNIKASRTPDGNEQIYMCEATNYFPEGVAMHWLLDGKKVDSPGKSNNEYFSKEICYRIQLKGNNQPSQISCEVQHETLQNPIKTTEEVKVERECKRSCHSGLIGVLAALLVTALPALWYYMKRDSQRFQVGHIHRMQAEDGRATMYCMASNCPKDVQVTWTITENNGEKIRISDIQQKRDEEAGLIDNRDYTVETNRSQSDNLYHAISALSFTPIISRHKEMEVSCTFQCNGRRQEKRLKCSFTFKKPEVSGPVHLSLGDNGDVLCSVSLQNFYPKNIKIKWSHGLGQFQDVETISETFTKNNDFTFDVRSECRVPGHLLKDQGYRVRATWSHETESGQQEASITDSEWRPVMGEIEKPAFIDGKEAKLLCRISGYFPDALDVKWLRRDTESQELYVVSASDKYKIPVSEATQQEDKTFTYTACLILSVSVATDYGSEYICRVRHPSLKTPLEQRTGELRVIGIRAVNVNVNKDKMRAEVLHFTPKDIKITWSRCTDNSNYKEYKDDKDVTLYIKTNSDGSYTGYSDITFKSHVINISERKYYKLVVRHEASDSVIEKNVLRENGKFHLIDNENRKTLLAQISDQQHDGNINAENLPAGIRAVNVTLLKKDKLRAEILHFTPKDIKITWSGRKGKDKNYEEYKDKDVTLKIETNSDGTYTGYSDYTFNPHNKSLKKQYKVVVRHEASDSVIEKNVLRENGEFYLIDNENRKTPLVQNSDQQQ